MKNAQLPDSNCTICIIHWHTEFRKTLADAMNEVIRDACEKA